MSDYDDAVQARQDQRDQKRAALHELVDALMDAEQAEFRRDGPDFRDESAGVARIIDAARDARLVATSAPRSRAVAATDLCSSQLSLEGGTVRNEMIIAYCAAQLLWAFEALLDLNQQYIIQDIGILGPRTQNASAASSVHARMAIRDILVRRLPVCRPLSDEITSALFELDEGIAAPMFERRRVRHVKARSIMPQKRLWALAHVRHLASFKIPIKAAEVEVAGAYGVTVATLRNWKRLVRQTLGNDKVDSVLSRYAHDDRPKNSEMLAHLRSDIEEHGREVRDMLRKRKPVRDDQ